MIVVTKLKGIGITQRFLYRPYPLSSFIKLCGLD